MVIAECGGGKVEGGQITELAFPDIALTAKVGDKQLHRRIGVLGGVVILQWAIDCVCDFMRDDSSPHRVTARREPPNSTRCSSVI